jgi:hypothetical protein
MISSYRRLGISIFFLLVCVATGRASEGSLSVKTTPEGVEVWIDDKYIGDTPIIDKKLKTGRYTLKLIDPIQHTSSSEEIFIQADESVVIEKTITAKFGSLKVSSDPEGAHVYIATELGKTPLSNDFMNPGKYRLEIKHPNESYASVTEDIVIPRGKTVKLSKTLEKTSAFDLKALVRLGLGAGAIVSYIWAVVEQGEYKYNTNEARHLTAPADIGKKQEYENNAGAAAAKRTVGIILGTVCVVGFEIVAFF